MMQPLMANPGTNSTSTRIANNPLFMVLFNNNYISVSNAILYIAQEICCALIISHGSVDECATNVCCANNICCMFVASVGQFIMGMMFLILWVSLFRFRTRSFRCCAHFSLLVVDCGLRCACTMAEALLTNWRASTLATVPSK